MIKCSHLSYQLAQVVAFQAVLGFLTPAAVVLIAIRLASIQDLDNVEEKDVGSKLLGLDLRHQLYCTCHRNATFSATKQKQLFGAIDAALFNQAAIETNSTRPYREPN